MTPCSRRERTGLGGKKLEGHCKVPAARPLQPVPVRKHTGADPTLGRAQGAAVAAARGTRREATAPPGTSLLFSSSSQGWKIYKARSENIYTAAIFGGIWDVNLKNLWGEDHNGPFERASVAIAPSRLRRRGAPPAAAPALMGASPAGNPPGSRGGCARRTRCRPAPLIASRAAGQAAPGRCWGQGCILQQSPGAASSSRGTAVTLCSAGGSRGASARLCSFSPNQTYLSGQGPNLENSSLKDKGLENY